MFTIVSQAGFALLVWGNFYLPIYKLTGSLYLNLLLYLPRWAFDSGKAGLLPELFLYIGWQRPEKCSWKYPYPYFKKYTILFQGAWHDKHKKNKGRLDPVWSCAIISPARHLSSARIVSVNARRYYETGCAWYHESVWTFMN